jgi:thioesterase domain-containing protein
MGVRVTVNDGSRLVLTAPLAPNINHLGTAFGGSLHTLPTLACYAGLWILLREAGLAGHVVVKSSEARYRQPVKGEIRAQWDRPAAGLVENFLTELRRHRKARLDLTAIVAGTEGKPAVEYSGRFVAVL